MNEIQKFKKSIDDCIAGKNRLDYRLNETDDHKVCQYAPSEESPYPCCKFQGFHFRQGNRDYYTCNRNLK